MDQYRDAGKKKKVASNLFIFVFSVYMVTASGVKGQLGGDNHLRYQVTSSIVEKYDLSVPNGFGMKGKDGRYYSFYGLGWSVLAVPFYILGKFLGEGSESLVCVMQLLAGAVTVTLIFLFCVSLGYSNRPSLITAIFYGLGTMAWPLAKQPFEHVVETLFVLLSVYYMYLFYIKERNLCFILSAVFMGIALTIRITTILVFPALFFIGGVFCLRNASLKNSMKIIFKHVVTYLIVLLPFIFIVMWYNYYRFGSIYETGYQLIAAKTGIGFLYGTPLLTGLHGFLLSPGKGIFYYSPVALLFFPAIVPFYKKNSVLTLAFLILILSNLLFFSKYYYWHGDWAWGPRYLLVILPFMIIPVVELLGKGSNKELKKVSLRSSFIYGIFCIGIIIQVAAVSVHCYKYFFDLQLDKNVQFVLKKGPGVPYTTEPPPEVHFDWGMSPISAQFLSIYEMGLQIANYNHVNLPENTPLSEKIKAYPIMHIYDFWWAYLYFIYRNQAGFLIAAAFAVICFISAHRLIKTSCFQQ